MHVSLKAVTKRFGKIRALDGVSFSVEPGQIVAVLGVNGAGKTTLLRALAGVVAPDAGSVLFDDERFHRGRIDLRMRSAFLPDYPLAFGHVTLLRHLGMLLNIYHADGLGGDIIPASAIPPPSGDPGERVAYLLRNFDLLPLIDTQMSSLSRGQLYKAGLAGLMAVDPELWLIDEPFASGMDPNGISFFKREARAAAARGRTILYSTQILDIAEGFSDRVCVLDHGELRVFAPVRELGPTESNGKGGVLEELFRKLREEPS